MNPEIRLLTYDDALPLQSLVEAGSAEVSQYGPTIGSGTIYPLLIQAILGGQALFCAEADGSLVGYCGWVSMPSGPEGTVYGTGTFVEKEHRGRGLAREMRERAIEHWRRLGFSQVIGTAAAGNQAGLDSAKAAGFFVSGHEMRFDLRGSDGE